MQYVQGLAVALTTTWTEVDPNFVISYAAVTVVSGSVEVQLYDETGWFGLKSGTADEVIQYIQSATKIRIRASIATASVNYQVKGNPFLIVAHAEKTTLVDDDLVIIEDSEDSNTAKKVKKSNIDPRFGKTTRVDSNTLLDYSYYVVFVDTDGGAVTITLPAGVQNREFRITNVGNSENNVTITPDGTEQIFGNGAGVSFTLYDSEGITINYDVTEGWK